jgi:uncharacterized protein (DUF1810 family)
VPSAAALELRACSAIPARAKFGTFHGASSIASLSPSSAYDDATRDRSGGRSEGTPVDVQRFVDAQAPVIDDAIAELAAGRKRTHWMWFVFPQLGCLGRSATARHYGLDSVDDAREYLAHPLLGERLKRCTRAVLAHRDRSAHDIFGSPDDLKFRSCMTLFGLAAPEEPVFQSALAQFFDGKPDASTLQATGRGSDASGR